MLRNTPTGPGRAKALPLVGVLNAGSSSLKFALFEGEARRFSGVIDGIGGDKLRAVAVDASGTPIGAPKADPAMLRSVADAVHVVLPWFSEHRGGRRLDGVGHRLVHGGVAHERPALVTPALLDDLERLVPLAPLHEPAGIAAIRAVAAEDGHRASRVSRHRVSSQESGRRASLRDHQTLLQGRRSEL